VIEHFKEFTISLSTLIYTVIPRSFDHQ